MKEHKQWTEAERIQLVRLWMENYEGKEIARIMDRTPRSVVDQISFLRSKGHRIPMRRIRARNVRRLNEAKCHPLVKFLVKEMQDQRATYGEIEARSGVSIHAIRDWQRGVSPRLANIEAVLNSLGYQMRVKPL